MVRTVHFRDSGKRVPPFANSTRYPDQFLKRMLSWACRQVELPRRKLNAVNFRNIDRYYRGLAYWPECRITVSIGPDCSFPCDARTHFDGFSVGNLADAIEALVKVTAHEVAHIAAFRRKATRKRCSGGNSERTIDWECKQALNAFRADRERLMAIWTAGLEMPPIEGKSTEKNYFDASELAAMGTTLVVPVVPCEALAEPEPMQVAALSSPASKAAVTRRANAVKRAETDLSNAETKIAEWKRKRALAETKLAAWEAKRKNAAKRLASLKPEKVS